MTLFAIATPLRCLEIEELESNGSRTRAKAKSNRDCGEGYVFDRVRSFIIFVSAHDEAQILGPNFQHR